MSENRPDAFLGNAPLVRRLKTRVAEGRLPHGLIFSGPEGTGKRTLALLLAQALNCHDSSVPGEGCGECESCRRAFAGAHPHVSLVGLDDDASQIKIEQVRAIRSELELSTPTGAARMYVIDPADRMNASAANALLKALEEPPERTWFVLITTNAHELLTTIRSRCQVYHFSPLGLDEIRASGVSDELVVRSSQGSIGRALATDPDQLRDVRATLLDFLELAVAASDADLARLPGASAELSRSKDEYRERIRGLGVLVSDLIYLREEMDARVVNVDEIERLRKIAARVELSRLVQIGDCLRFIERALKQYVNRQMLTDALALTLNAGTAEILNDKAWEYR